MRWEQCKSCYDRQRLTNKLARLSKPAMKKGRYLQGPRTPSRRWRTCPRLDSKRTGLQALMMCIFAPRRPPCSLGIRRRQILGAVGAVHGCVRLNNSPTLAVPCPTVVHVVKELGHGRLLRLLGLEHRAHHGSEVGESLYCTFSAIRRCDPTLRADTRSTTSCAPQARLQASGLCECVTHPNDSGSDRAKTHAAGWAPVKGRRSAST